MNQKKIVPRRAYRKSDAPIMGLGCSSFSTDWLSKEEREKAEGVGREEGDLSWVRKDHPLVKTWISTITHAVEERGINILDTAPWYGHGSSETVIGMAMHELEDRGIERKDLIINTKVGRYSPDPARMFDFSYKRAIDSTVLSVERMNCQYIDVLQLHDPEYSPSLDLLIQHTIPAMIKLKGEGIVKAIGITGYPLDYQRIIIEEAAKKGLYFDQSLTYCHYNLHDQSLITAQNNNSLSYAEFCAKNSIEMLCAAPFSMGLLTTSGPPFWHPSSPSLKDACKIAVDLCEENKINISRLALLFAFSNPCIACTMVGLSSIEQVDFSADIACLFHDYQGNSSNGNNSKEVYDQNILNLKNILSRDEYKVLEQLLDKQNGTFSAVHSNDEYQWDGLMIADQFWEKVPGGKLEAAKRMSSNI